MTGNTDLWDRLGKTDPAHTKQFKRAGGFSGTAIKPMWSYRRLTEEFGPCGTGWGVDKPEFQVVAGENREVMVFCTVSGWYLNNGERRAVFGVGGDKVVSYVKANEQYRRPERWENDDEAFKKAFTDALTNAFKLVGVGADVHMGLFDDNKYVNAIRQEFADEPRTTDRRSPQGRREVQRAGQGADADKPASAAEQKRQLAEIDKDLLDCNTVGDVNKCAKIWAAIMDRDGWSAEYREFAKPKFQARREELAARQDDTFPGDTDITDRSGRRLNTMEAA